VAELQKLYDGWNAEQAEPTVPDSKPKKQERKKKKRTKAKDSPVNGTSALVFRLMSDS
jgi:hypothetical protein